MMKLKELWIPTTKKVSVTEKVVYRPIRSWHSGTFAGEGLYKIPGTNDGSGCLWKEKFKGILPVTSPPCSVTHRLYWHIDNPRKRFSAFLSYPQALGAANEYFWECFIDKEARRFFGCNGEKKLEAFLVEELTKLAKKKERVRATKYKVKKEVGKR